MLDAQDISAKTSEVQQQLRAKLGVRSSSLDQGLRRAGRRLPRDVRRQGDVLLKAQKLAENPRLARQLRPVEVNAAYKRVTEHLRGIDVSDRRKGWWLSLAGSIATNLLLVSGAFLTWAWWRGYI
ncbi:MAG: hypothetical protein AAF744_04590 [Pseudomonadota bacterium]